jgi:hypothetical protein
VMLIHNRGLERLETVADHATAAAETALIPLRYASRLRTASAPGSRSCHAGQTNFRSW